MSQQFPVKESEYKGHSVFSIKIGEYTSKGETKDNTFSFGVQKAKAILDNIDEIKAFVERNEGKE